VRLLLTGFLVVQQTHRGAFYLPRTFYVTVQPVTVCLLSLYYCCSTKRYLLGQQTVVSLLAYSTHNLYQHRSVLY
jgi:hypothetical protein